MFIMTEKHQINDYPVMRPTFTAAELKYLTFTLAELKYLTEFRVHF